MDLVKSRDHVPRIRDRFYLDLEFYRDFSVKYQCTYWGRSLRLIRTTTAPRRGPPLFNILDRKTSTIIFVSLGPEVFIRVSDRGISLNQWRLLWCPRCCCGNREKTSSTLFDHHLRVTLDIEVRTYCNLKSRLFCTRVFGLWCWRLDFYGTSLHASYPGYSGRVWFFGG